MNKPWNRAARGAVVMFLPAIAAGQTVSPTMSDATIVARGSFRFRGQVEWTHFDALFGVGGKTTQALGASLTANVDIAALPLLGPAQLATRTLAKAPSLQLSLGALRTAADSRIATIPFSVEYGLTQRITLGINVPIVQARTVLTTQLNGRSDSTANIGVNPAGFLLVSAAFNANAQVTSGLEAARQQLLQRMATCTASPASAGCPAFNARAVEAAALAAEASSFTDAAKTLYGVSAADPGAPFVPIAGSPIQQAVDNHLSDLRFGFTSFGINGGSGSFAAAKERAANAQLQQLVSNGRYGIGLDSIGSTDQLSIGDIELSLASRLFNSFSDTLTGGLHWRGAVAGVVRLGTGRPARQNRPLDIGTGDGQTDVEVRGAIDMMLGNRLLTTVAGTYTQQLGSVKYDRLPYPPGLFFGLLDPEKGSIKPGNMAAVRVNPRFLVTRGLMIGGLISASHRGADQVTMTDISTTGADYGNPNSVNTWAGGLTLSYSNLATRGGTGDARFPAEVHFSHLETVSANAGAAKSTRDAIELRLYFRTRR